MPFSTDKLICGSPIYTTSLSFSFKAFHDLEEERKNAANNTTPRVKLLRPALFWDTDISKLDWNRQKRAIVHRVYERGNPTEKRELIRFYGKESVDAVLKGSPIKKTHLR